MFSIKAWRRNRIVQRNPIADDAWKRTVRRLPTLKGLSAEELSSLRRWTALFLYQKSFEGARGFKVTDTMRIAIAAQACLLILNLDVDYYEGVNEIILYRDTFVVSHEQADDAGVAHLARHALAGESWERGPVVLSWADAKPGAYPFGTGTNVIIHEFAHKIDMLNGAANGLPPLHRQMDAAAWSRIFLRAFKVFRRRLAAGSATSIDPYAADNPGEFFAVLSEAFYEIPRSVAREFPDVYRQLSLFYRQDPAAR
jgi:Mlc titration factor MtfA (ptsG expression regulator)